MVAKHQIESHDLMAYTTREQTFGELQALESGEELRWEDFISYRGTTIQMTVDISSEAMEARTPRNTLKELKGKKPVNPKFYIQ